ncbi:hypothetical protein Csa_016577 [Cucumis sativus]|nr:hypothetical protein Csa_016577 [Cucumis sativus]
MFVEEVTELIELDKLRDALVGLPGIDGLSTEQRKRLKIAVELVANPSTILMDEPTSGLDARSAAIVMRTMRNIIVAYEFSWELTRHEAKFSLYQSWIISSPSFFKFSSLGVSGASFDNFSISLARLTTWHYVMDSSRLSLLQDVNLMLRSIFKGI